MLKLHIMNSSKRNATVGMTTLRYRSDVQMGVSGKKLRMQRYVQATESGMRERLSECFGDNYGQELINSDPEVDLENTGRRIGVTDVVFLSNNGEVLHAPPKIIEVLLDTTGKECDRREPVDVNGNVRDDIPLIWTGKKMPKSKVVRMFAFARTIQLQHLDGLSFDFLSEIAKELASEGVVVLLGAGKGGKDPLVFQANGTPYRGFLEGRVDGDRFKLLLHLSNMELKRDSDGFNPRFQTKND